MSGVLKVDCEQLFECDWNFAFSAAAVARICRLTSIVRQKFDAIRGNRPPPRSFRACRVIYNFHEIFTRRSRMPAKPRHSRNFANFATVNAKRVSKLAHSRSIAPKFSELIKCKRAKLTDLITSLFTTRSLVCNTYLTVEILYFGAYTHANFTVQLSFFFFLKFFRL